MIATKASLTAQMVAAYRARASRRPNPVCSDPWAGQLAGEQGADLARQFDELFPHMELWSACRTAYLDEHVRYWTEQFDQVVVLGAGLDTRAARLARPGVVFYEVDHPATQQDKRRRLQDLPGYPSDAPVYAPCDFERDDFLDRLVQVGFAATRPAVIVWEGVVPYLSESAVRSTLCRLASGCHEKTVVLFDYVMKRLAEGTDLPARDAGVRALVAGLGEPVRFGINEPVDLLYEAGFRHVRVTSFNEICLSLTGTYERARMFRFQHIALVSRFVHSLR
jgi:methyltransferase (TIGR00027 family)